MCTLAITEKVHNPVNGVQISFSLFLLSLSLSLSLSPTDERTIPFQAFYAEQRAQQKPAANFLICNDTDDEAQKPQSKKETIGESGLCGSPSLPIHPNSILSWQSNKCHHKRDAKWLQLCKIIIDLLSLLSPSLPPSLPPSRTGWLLQCTLDGRTEWC